MPFDKTGSKCDAQNAIGATLAYARCAGRKRDDTFAQTQTNALMRVGLCAKCGTSDFRRRPAQTACRTTTVKILVSRRRPDAIRSGFLALRRVGKKGEERVTEVTGKPDLGALGGISVARWSRRFAKSRRACLRSRAKTCLRHADLQCDPTRHRTHVSVGTPRMDELALPAHQHSWQSLLMAVGERIK